MTTPIISPNDKRVYRVLNLDNKLQCLIISDKDADKAAGAVSVGVGQLQDPEERPGLAHFLEHMLFLGTEKYPSQNDYSSYILANSGMDNAFTALQETNYYFDVAAGSLEGALDRFAQFFIHPLFTEDCTEKEINAVDSENKKNLMLDGWRRYQLFRSSSKQGHPYNKFGTGNKETLLHPSIRQDLLKFYGDYYSANIMKFVLYGKEDIDTLEKWTTSLFSQVKNKNTVVTDIKEKPFDKELCGNFWKVVPIEDTDYLDIIWIIDSTKPYYKYNLGHYFSAIIGHEGKNSLLSYLIDEGLALELSAGQHNTLEIFGELEVSIKLTKKGLAEYERVYAIVFQYLKVLRDHGISKEHYEELKTVLKMKFQFKDKEKPIGYAQGLASKMHYYPIEDIVRVSFMMEEFKPELLQSLLDSLTLDNLRIYLVSKTVANDCNMSEKWYNTKYTFDKFNDKVKSAFANPNIGPSKSGKILDLSPINRFIPKNFDLYTAPETSSKYPVKLISENGCDIWFKQDHAFKKPKSSVYFILTSTDAGFGTHLESFFSEVIWSKLFQESLREFAYEAKEAAVNYGLEDTFQGIQIQANGFNDSMKAFCEGVFLKMKDFNPLDWKERFEDVRRDQIDKQRNWSKNSPYQQAQRLQEVVTQKGHHLYLPTQAIKVLEKLSFEDLLAFHKSFLTNVRIEGFIAGNFTPDMAKEISEIVKKTVFSIKPNSASLSKDEVPEVRAVNVPSGNTYVYEQFLQPNDMGEKESNSSIIAHFQYEGETPQSMALTDVMANYLKDPCFDTLRTTEQLGYITSGYKNEFRGILSYHILVQSAIKSPQFISQRITAFLEKMREKIKTVTEEEFAKFVESSRVRIAQADLSIAEEAERYWRVIQKHTYQFNRKEVFLEELTKLKPSDMMDLFEQIFFKNRKLVETHVVAEGHAVENSTLKNERLSSDETVKMVPSPEWLIRRLPLYPDYNSMI